MNVEILVIIADQAYPMATTARLVNRSVMKDPDRHRSAAVEDFKKKLFGAIHTELGGKA